ncbi:hypothetical protein F3Y22_tig00110013pilonHSYRG00334 [Hibiscus syriacus]|uniref:Uncharacterized protein n=1 Tax=Hibiscus syriacus TaxID=106335 RepID=A0A6A3BNJ3_HIBSY|nr:hypothetical protein F3Y22_tig00110013pilonHSYRG00334 [Hibiscus syriacus]
MSTTMSISELDDETVRSMSIGAVFSDFGGKISSLDFHRKDDLLVKASEDDSVRLYDIANAKPTVAYDEQDLVFVVAMEGGAIKLFDSRSYDKGPFDTFFVGGDTAEVCNIKFRNDGKTTNNNIYVLDAYGEKLLWNYKYITIMGSSKCCTSLLSFPS